VKYIFRFALGESFLKGNVMRLPKFRLLAVIVVSLAVLGAGVYVSRTSQPVSNDKITNVNVTEVSYTGVEGKNALELLRAGHSIETKTSSFGDYVQSIDGVAADSSHFWGFYVNGKMAEVGAGSYVTKSSDTVLWKLEAIQ
jgi:hypothetical protein